MCIYLLIIPAFQKTDLLRGLCLTRGSKTDVEGTREEERYSCLPKCGQATECKWDHNGGSLSVSTSTLFWLKISQVWNLEWSYKWSGFDFHYIFPKPTDCTWRTYQLTQSSRSWSPYSQQPCTSRTDLRKGKFDILLHNGLKNRFLFFYSFF